jgi:puromycin-sensitive aminopeptidase
VPADAADATDESAYRLPRTVLPRRYELTIEPDLDAATFVGEEAVAVEVVEPVAEIVLNAKELEIDEAWLTVAGSRVDCTASIDADRERLVLTPARTVDAGDANVHVRFHGLLNDKLTGFYRSVYSLPATEGASSDEGGRQHVIGTTQMEATDARMAFPCWDEPDLKAVFAVTLVVADGLLAVSNATEVGRTATGDGRVAVEFADTIPMSTYLVAFVVGPLEVTDPVDVRGTPLRIVHVPGKAHLAPFALEVGAFCLEWFADWYGIPYPGDKVDLIALPDFAAGAMENLGAITFREAVLLIDPEQATQLELQRVADVIAHELAHMWFGDLVTMKWWNGLWLNEAFATFMELAAVDAFRPEWQRWVAFTNERAAAFAVDSLESTRPIEYPVRSPADADGMFDVLTYQKGASVLRMLQQFLGEDGFRAGIRLYLKSREYGNAETTDLWDAIEEATGEPVRHIMDTWIFQGGHPMVGIDAVGDDLTVDQHIFRYVKTDVDARWAVPLLVRVDDTTHKVLVDDRTMTTTISGAGDGVVANAGGHGFYRVRYSPTLLGALRPKVMQLAPVERALLVDDTWAAVLAGDTEAIALLDLLEGYTDETEPAVWSTIAGVLGALDRILDGDGRAAFQSYVRNLAGPALQRFGWEPADGESELARQARQTVITTLGTTGADPSVRARAREIHASGDADPNVMAATVAIVAATGTADDHAAFLDRYKTSPSPQEQLRYLYALGGFPDQQLAQESLALTLTDTIRSQNAPFLIQLLLQNRDVNELTWEFVKGEWEAINARFPDNTIPRLLGGVTTLSTAELERDVERFLANHPVPQGVKTIEQHLERLRVNTALRERESGRLGEALQRR